ncbi:MAG: MBL fold metallo-hydrolase [Beijerinckiaceae bacterium]|nr:MBL fold metallo-hydrolase [Beijerinckiaceae bacterium]
MRLLLATLVALGALCAGAFAQWPPEPQMELREITKNVWTMQHPLGSSNSTFIVTDEGVFVWDADVRTAGQVLAAIRRTTDKKVRYVAFSHAAGDHATGAWHFREDQPHVIGTRKQLRDLYMQEGEQFAERKASADPRFGAFKASELVIPDIAFEGALMIRFGGLTLQLTEEGSAHSNSDVTLYIPQRRVFLTGDLLNTEIHPGQGESAGVFFSNTKNWVNVLDNIKARALPVDTYVPGHGPVHIGRGVADIEEQRRYFIAMRDEVSKLIAAGKSVQQVQSDLKLPAEFAHYKSTGRLKNYLNLFYHQLLEQGYWP